MSSITTPGSYMSYDYSSESQRLELPNPHKIENIFLFITAAFYLIAGLVTLFMAKEYLAQSKGWEFFIPFIATVFLLGLGIRFAAQAMLQLRFFFGRGLPVGLTTELPQGIIGKSEGIDVIKEDIRRGALKFEEPHGALNGLLYHRIPQLIVAPAPLQRWAQAQFRNGLVLVLSLASLLVAWMGFGHSNSAHWIGLFYFLFASWLVLKPIAKGSINQAYVNESGVIALVIVAVIGPVVIGYGAKSLPDLSWLALQWQALFLLVAALASVALFCVALLRQLSPAPSTSMSCEQLSLNINSHPAQIMGEFDRVMQQKWVEKIPNRRYARIDPSVDTEAKAGTFFGEVVEETQPMPSATVESLTWKAALGSDRTRWLVYLNALGMLLLAAAAGAMVMFVSKFDPHALDWSRFSTVTFAFVAYSVGIFCFRASANLWGRFDFISEIIWIELSGQYTTARNRLGNDFTSTVRTDSHAINIESMTMRVWTARIESVVFGKNKERIITAMNGQSEITHGLAAHLAEFARSRSMFVAPANPEDLQKIAATHAAQQMHAGSASAPPHLQALLPTQHSTQQSQDEAAAATKFCTECGKSHAVAAKFCLGCGHKFAQ